MNIDGQLKKQSTTVTLVNPLPFQIISFFRPVDYNIKLIPLELINSHGDTIRKAKEAVLIIINNTLERHGMNKRHKTQSVFICIFFTIILIIFAPLFLLYTYLLFSLSTNQISAYFNFYLAFSAPEEGKFCLTKILGNKIFI